MNNTYYFSHDYNARTDPKIKRLIARHGMLGYGIFWAIIEDLYNNANALPLDCESIAYDLRIDCQTINSILYDFDLFQFSDDTFGSLSIERRLASREDKSNKARESANKRWQKVKENQSVNANAMRTHSEGNAIKGKEIKEKEKKGNEIKGNEIKESNSYELIFPFSSLEFMNVWNALRKQPKWKRKTQDALQASLKQLSRLSEPEAIETMERSIAGGWQGLFPNKETQAKVAKKENALDQIKRFQEKGLL